MSRAIVVSVLAVSLAALLWGILRSEASKRILPFVIPSELHASAGIADAENGVLPSRLYFKLFPWTALPASLKVVEKPAKADATLVRDLFVLAFQFSDLPLKTRSQFYESILFHPDLSVRVDAIRALGNMASARAVPKLLQLWDLDRLDHYERANLGVALLKAFDPRCKEALKADFAGENPSRRAYAAAVLLERVGGESFRRELERFITQGERRLVANLLIVVLPELKPRQAVPLLRAATLHKDVKIARLAKKKLAESSAKERTRTIAR